MWPFGEQADLRRKPCGHRFQGREGTNQGHRLIRDERRRHPRTIRLGRASGSGSPFLCGGSATLGSGTFRNQDHRFAASEAGTALCDGGRGFRKPDPPFHRDRKLS